uniref:Uncharacterized protein n=1 Tax=Cyprinus carpio TaxID=7962 RepID=A0A8C2ED55_CYPCA
MNSYWTEAAQLYLILHQSSFVSRSFTFTVNYSQPLVAVKFTDLSFNTDFNVECKIKSSSDFKISERDKFAGRVNFKLRINKV